MKNENYERLENQLSLIRQNRPLPELNDLNNIYKKLHKKEYATSNELADEVRLFWNKLLEITAGTVYGNEMSNIISPLARQFEELYSLFGVVELQSKREAKPIERVEKKFNHANEFDIMYIAQQIRKLTSEKLSVIYGMFAEKESKDVFDDSYSVSIDLHCIDIDLLDKIRQFVKSNGSCDSIATTASANNAFDPTLNGQIDNQNGQFHNAKVSSSDEDSGNLLT